MVEQDRACTPFTPVWAGLALGFGLGGFFDGILLHQVLQWHHLLSGIQQARQDIRLLIMADGLFHVLMYVITGIGLLLLWRARREWGGPEADRAVLANALVGFGGWHWLDAILSHWVLGIHRIRMDVANPLLWDLSWVLLFGLLPLIAGWTIRRRGHDKATRVMNSPFLLVAAVLISAPVASLPPPAGGPVMAWFRPDMSAADAAAAIVSIGGRLIWNDQSGQVWVFETTGGAGQLYAKGALLVGNSIVPVGCSSWIDTDVPTRPKSM